jgi:hypothetical protein
MLNFKKFLYEQNTVGTHNDGPGAAYLSSEFTGSEAPENAKFDGRPPHLSSLDAILPSISKTGQIRMIERNKNPIFILLSDGTQLYLSWDEFKRIKGPTPETGKNLTVVFQRNATDTSQTPSRINSILCH